MMAVSDPDQWEARLRAHVENRPVVLIKLSDAEFGALLASKKGMTEFSLTFPHEFLEGVVPPTMCLVLGTRVDGYGPRRRTQEYVYAAVLKSKKVIASLSTRVKVERVARVRPAASRLGSRLQTARFSKMFEQRLTEDAPLSRLSPKLSVAILDVLLATSSNRGALRIVATGLSREASTPVEHLQSDAVQTALRAFGLTTDARAAQLELIREKRSTLTGARVLEDAVIEHDARNVPEYELVGSDVTGRATFRNGNETLEVFTANRRKLEDVFGVDLIYLNRFHGNVVMVQYKMLEPGERRDAAGPDWIYSQDRHLGKQLAAMKRFADYASSKSAYRLSREFFYFKFVQRHSTSSASNLLMPLAHVEELMRAANFQNRSGGLRLSYRALGGRYMRQTAFFSLLQAGYIGADVQTTEALRTLIEDLLSGGDALVIALQRETSEAEEDLDRERNRRLYEDADAGYH